MSKFDTQLTEAKWQPLNGKTDPFDLLSSVTGHIGDAQGMLEESGVLGWQPEMIPLSGMDSRGNIYDVPDSAQGIVVPQFPGGPALFGQAHKDFKFIRPEELIPLVDAIVAHGNPLTGVMPGPVTRLFFDSKSVDMTDGVSPSVGDIVKFRWHLRLGNTGKNSLKIGQSGVRLICSNGMTTDETMGAVSIQHSSLAPQKIDATVSRILAAGDIGLEKWIEDARKLISTRLSQSDANLMWAKIFDWRDDKEKNALTIQENQQSALNGLWGSNTQTTTYPETGWAFFNATTEYLDHLSRVHTGGASREVALARRVVEGNAPMDAKKNQAWKMALALA